MGAPRLPDRSPGRRRSRLLLLLREGGDDLDIGQRIAEEIALPIGAAERPHAGRLLGGLDALGDRGHVHRATHRDDRAGQRR